MFKGAFILALGYAVGYAHAAAQNERVGDLVDSVKDVVDLAKSQREAAMTAKDPETPTNPEGEVPA